MAKTEPVLVLTRPEPDSLSFLEDLRGRIQQDLSHVISPVLEIHPLEVSVDLQAYRTLIFTSRNAVWYFKQDLRGREVATVGKRTADLAVSFGARAICLGDNVDDFLKNVRRIEPPAVHLRGVHGRGQLADHARAMGADVDELVVYDQVARRLSAPALDALTSGRAVVPVFSPRTAKLISANPCSPTTRVLAISTAAADAWEQDAIVEIAERPDRLAMLDLVTAAF